MMRLFSSKNSRILIGILWLPVLIWFYKEPILTFIQTHYPLDVIYQYSLTEIQAKTYMGASILIFLGNLFFIVFLPKYAVFIYFSTQTKLFVPVLILSAVLAMFMAMLVNYVLGYLFSWLYLRLFREQAQRLEDWLSRWGIYIIMFSYLFPLGFPHSFLSLMAGAVRFPFKPFVFATAVGCIIYFFLLNQLQIYLMPYVNKAF